MKTNKEAKTNTEAPGTSWQLYVLMGVLVLSILGMILKAIGLF